MRPLIVRVLFLVLVASLAGPAIRAESDAGENESTESEQMVSEVAEGDETLEAPEQDQSHSTSLVQTMQGDSGVSVATMCTNCNNADLSVSGMSDDFVQLTCDGIPVSSGLAQVYLLAIMPPTVIDKVSVTKGAGDAAGNGGAVGGQIEIETRKPDDRLALNASADVGSYNWAGTRLDLSGRSDWFGGTLIASVGRQDVVDANDDGNPDLPSFERYTVQGGLDFHAGDNHVFRLGGSTYKEDQKDGPAGFYAIGWLGTGDVVYNLENVDLRLNQYSTTYEGSFGDVGQLNVALSRSDRTQIIDETRIPGQSFDASYDINDLRDQASAAWSSQFGYRVQFRAGASAQEQVVDLVDYNTIFIAGSETYLTERPTDKGIWADVAIIAGSKVDLTLGARYVDYTYTDNEEREPWLVFDLPEGSKTLPRLALTYKPTPPVELRFTAGTGYRQPQPIFEEVCCGRRYRGNRGILMEESRSWGFEVNYQPSPKLRVNGSYLASDFDDLILTMVTTVYGGSWSYQHANVPEARLTTYAFDTQWQAADWLSFKASASWLDAANQTPDGAIPALADWFNTPREWTFHTDRVPYLYDLRGTLGLDFFPRKGLSNISVMAQYTGDMLIQRMADDPFSFSYVLDSALLPEFYESDAFWMFNLRLSRTLPKGITIYGGVDNIGDYVQADQGDPRTDYNWGPLQGRYYSLGLSYSY